MRKLLFIVCSIVLFAACSSDDDDKNEYGTKIGEFNAYGGVEKVSDYLFKNYRIIGDATPFYMKIGDNNVAYVVSAICPKEKEGHTYTDGSTEGCIEVIKSGSGYTYYWNCPQCDSQFKFYTGEASNSIAKGYTLQTYRLVRVNDYGKFEIRK